MADTPRHICEVHRLWERAGCIDAAIAHVAMRYGGGVDDSRLLRSITGLMSQKTILQRKLRRACVIACKAFPATFGHVMLPSYTPVCGYGRKAEVDHWYVECCRFYAARDDNPYVYRSFQLRLDNTPVAEIPKQRHNTET